MDLVDSTGMSTRSFGDMGTASTSTEFQKSYQDRALSVQEDQFMVSPSKCMSTNTNKKSLHVHAPGSMYDGFDQFQKSVGEISSKIMHADNWKENITKY